MATTIQISEELKEALVKRKLNKNETYDNHRSRAIQVTRCHMVMLTHALTSVILPPRHQELKDYRDIGRKYLKGLSIFSFI